ncbi:MAG: YegS/Rv2252/BmrU family lipid kinase [Rikenellaceae bacterium]|jgi:YegS/Rv2252/BmrU family lipid kinase|nr:YegS/Rv2252/BmrU family lipid kinase [Rikenellaceae bacterium]
MKRVKFIYNPSSGDNQVYSCLDEIIALYQRAGYSLVPYRLDFAARHEEAIEDIDETYHHVLAAGGDGTVNHVVNMLQHNSIDIPLAIIPTGTANDFAKHIGMPGDILDCCRRILGGEARPVDIGLASGAGQGRYFINIFACGLFTEISHKTSSLMKNTFGRMAYIFGTLGEMPNLRRMNLRIASDGGSFEGSCLLLAVFNGKTAGQMPVAHRARIDDGLLDVVILRGERTLAALAESVAHLTTAGKPTRVKQSEIVHFQCSQLTIESRADKHGKHDEPTDVDGQPGPAFPLKITCLPGAQQIIMPGKVQKSKKT